MNAILKKQPVGTVWTDVKSKCYRAMMLPVFALSLLCACNEDKAKPESPDEKDLLQEITPVLAPEGDDFEGVANYGVYLYLFNEMSSVCYKYQSADAFSDLKSFVVERAAYSLVALMMNPQSANLSFEASMQASRNEKIEVVDMNREIPDLVLAATTVQQTVDAPVSLSTINRLVGRLNIRLTDVPQEITAIEVTVDGLYDQVNLIGQYGFSNGQSVSKTFALLPSTATTAATRSGSTFSNSVITLPSDTDLSTLRMVFHVSKGSQSEDFTVKFTGGVKANQIATLEGRAEDLLKNAAFAAGLTYAPWDSSTTVEDDLTIKDDLNKKWSSAALPIGGASTYNNFWASSSLNTDWAHQYDSYLYDGIKDIDHKDEYWGPDVDSEVGAGTIPSWYIDLGASKEGVTITYWNKFGGAGGQKAKTFKVYGSNTVGDYEGGNENWTLITTFTSDRTAPSVDAGAEVTTGQIKFNEGNTSYRYVKCEFISRVTSGGVFEESSDVNISEAEIVVWSCK